MVIISFDRAVKLWYPENEKWDLERHDVNLLECVELWKIMKPNKK